MNNPYIVLSLEDTDTYLFLLRIIGTSYTDFTIPEDMFAVMERNEQLSDMVGDILSYKHDNDALLPEFTESFSEFWNSRIAGNNPVVNSALNESFDIQYDAPTQKWRLVPKGEGSTATSGRRERITLSKFNSLTDGMSYAQVVEIIGEQGTLQSETTLFGITTSMYSWNGAGLLGGTATVMFQDDRLISKSQIGLR
jgi:hypothetical protein